MGNVTLAHNSQCDIHPLESANPSGQGKPDFSLFLAFPHRDPSRVCIKHKTSGSFPLHPTENQGPVHPKSGTSNIREGPLQSAHVRLPRDKERPRYKKL